MTKIGLIGCGMWGKNLARNLAQLNVLAAVSDRYDDKAAEFAKQFNNKNEISSELNKILEKMIRKNPNQWIWTHDRWK